MVEIPDPFRKRRQIGLLLYLLATMGGGGLLLIFFLLLPVATGHVQVVGFMALGAAFAFPAAFVYLTVPRLLDRYDPEPWYALFGCLVWGGVAATGYSVMINSAVGELIGGPAGEVVSTVVSAPIVEEGFKGLGLFGVFFFLRDEFDGVVDGIIYACFIGLGFATIENVTYYATAAEQGDLGETLFARGILSPWVHPVYTMMTGIGFGLRREALSRWLRALGPALGWLLAVMLHGIWNGSAILVGELGMGGVVLFAVMMVMWALLVLTFLIIVVVLVRRRGRIIRQHLQEEVAIGTLTNQEIDIVCSAFGLIRARLRWGATGEQFVRAAARLGLSKWHAARALRLDEQSFSLELVTPLRQRIAYLRGVLTGGGAR